MVQDKSAELADLGKARFLANLDLIDRVIRFHCHRSHLNPDQADEFAGHVRLKLIEDNYAVLAKFQGRSTLRTFLAVVIKRLLLDYRISQWGKWRPSAVARRAGPIGVQLEMLLTRDGRTFEEAYEFLTTGRAISVTRADLEKLAAQLPVKVGRHFESPDVLVDHPSPEPSPDATLEARERQSAAVRLAVSLTSAVNRLEPQDRLIMTMHFFDGYPVVEIAHTLGLEQKALYRRIERLLLRLRHELEEAGIDKQTVLDSLETRANAFEVSQEADQLSGTGGIRPSIKIESEVGS